MGERAKRVEVAAAEDQETADDTASGSHLDDIEDGCGCAEVWEHMSDRRAED
jgi:hypothetical protein